MRLSEALEVARTTVCRYWPHHWTVVEACLSAYATLLLKDVGQALALVMIARSGAGKGTILSFFQGSTKSMWRDSFTRSSLLSGSGDVSKAVAEKDALFRLVKDKVLLVGDLAPVLRSGDREKLSDFYTHFSVWMDGRGLMRQVGTHGTIGEKGDFQFVLIGAMTPLTMPLWRGMAELGPRLLFLPLERGNGEVAAHEYTPATETCGKAVRLFLTRLFAAHKLRSLSWASRSEAVDLRLRRLGELMALGQTLPASSLSEEPAAPTPAHLRQRLTTLLTGRALIHDRAELNEADLALGELIVCRTTPARRGIVLLALDRGGAATAEAIAAGCGMTYHEAWSTLDSLRKSGVVESTAKPFALSDAAGRPAELWTITNRLLNL